MSLDNACIAGLDGYFKRLNPSWTRTLGWTNEELLSRPSLEFVHPDDRAATLAGRHRLSEGAPLGHLVNRYLCKDGSYRWFEWRSVSEPSRGLVFASARDITEQRLAEEQLGLASAAKQKLEHQLIVAGRMASVGTLAAGVAHEINNPLASVSGNLAMLLEEIDLGPDAPSPEQTLELKELAREAQAGAERIRKIVRGLQTFSRVEEERQAVIHVQPLLELSISMASNAIRHRGRLIRDFGATPPVEASEGRLGQVFVNLLVNATQALQETEQSRNEIRIVTSTDSAGRAVIEVRDTGCGIPAAIIDRVFEPFFTTKPVSVGTGLGLSICHTIVTGMGGEISVTSEAERETTFRVVLPGAHPAPSLAPKPHAATPQPEFACAAVLVVDDEPALGTVLRRVLREHEVTVVTSAKHALDLLTSGQQFDVILSDLMMPEMSGMAFHAELERRFPAMLERVAFVTAGAFTPSASAFLERVSNERIRKPFEPGVVRQVVQRLAQRSKKED